MSYFYHFVVTFILEEYPQNKLVTLSTINTGFSGFLPLPEPMPALYTTRVPVLIVILLIIWRRSLGRAGVAAAFHYS